MESTPKLSAYDLLLELNAEIKKNVGETLARVEGTEQIASGEGDAKEGSEEEETPEEENASSETVVTEVKTTDVVNIRTSDSATADKIGKAAVGDTFKLLETKGNGWSKVEYNGGEAYMKSDFLEPSKTEVRDVASEGAEEGTTLADTSETGDASASTETTVR